MDDDKYRSLLLEKNGKEAQSTVADYLVRSEISLMCYAYKYRVKSQEKLIEKKNRKIKDKPTYDLEDITDIVGLRLVALFRRDMPELVELIVSAIMQKDKVRPNPFRANSIEEIIIYSTNPKYDTIIPEVKERLKRHSIFDDKIEKKHSDGYSSIHIVARLYKNIPELSNGDYYLPIEIQIRTVFEDAWGEIDHKYGYVIRSGKDFGYPINNPEFVLEHLKVLKRFSDACAEYADLIYSEASPLSELGLYKGKIISVDVDDELIARFKELDIKQGMIDNYISGREVKLHAQQVASDDKGEMRKLYMQAAEMFREIVSDDKESYLEPDNRGKYLFYYYVKMNEAVCLMSTGNLDNIKAANNIYSVLEDYYPNFPLLKMRSAQSYAKLGNSDIALEKYYQSKELTKSLQTEDGQWRDELPQVDFNHLCKVLPKLLGYELWKKSTNTTEISDKLSLIRRAYNETKEGIQSDCVVDRDLQSYYNNLLYYCVDYFKQANGYGDAEVFSMSEIEEYLSKLEEQIDIEKCNNLDQIDTMAYAYDYIGNKEKALRAANRTLALAVSGGGGTYSDAIRLYIANNARQIIDNCETK